MALTRYLEVAFLLAVAFPYTQVLVTIPSYNQPYVYLLAILLIRPRKFLQLPKPEVIVVGFFALTGAFMFLMTALPGPNFQEYKYFLNFAAPLILIPIGYDIAVRRRKMMANVLAGAILLWFVVGIIQNFFDPNFLTSLVQRRTGIAYDFVMAGRGVLGFAPEPTHFGLHMIVLAAMYSVVGKQKWVYVVSLISIVILAKSTGALFALACGALIWGVLNYRKNMLLIICSVGAVLVAVSLLRLFGEGEIRLIYLLNIFVTEGLRVIEYDYSSNARLGGVYLSYKEAFLNGLLPHGFNYEVWLNQNRIIYNNNVWLIGLSQTGFPSGFGLVLYQAGFLALPLIFLFIARIVRFRADIFATFLCISMFFVFNMQYYLATPGFATYWGMLLATNFYRNSLNRSVRINVD